MARIVKKKVVVPRKFNFPAECIIPVGSRRLFLLVAGENDRSPQELCGHKSRGKCNLC